MALFAGTGVACFSGDGRLATLATLREPWGLAVDELRDCLLIADTANNRIRYIPSPRASSSRWLAMAPPPAVAMVATPARPPS